jgi:hypothetical protein
MRRPPAAALPSSSIASRSRSAGAFESADPAYVLARRFVFQATGRRVASELNRFTIVKVFSLVFVWSIGIGLA